MNTIKSILGWIKPRWLRLAIGAVFLTLGIIDNDNLQGFIGVLFLIQGVMNQSFCAACAGGACEIPQNKKSLNSN